LQRDRTRDDIGAAAGCGGHDEAHGLRRILARRRACERQQQQRRYCSSSFLAATTFFHFSISAPTWRFISSGLLALGVPPHSANLCPTSLSASILRASRFKRSTTAGGIPAGPARPMNEVASYPGTLSATVGTSGSALERSTELTATGLNFPPWICG